MNTNKLVQLIFLGKQYLDKYNSLGHDGEAQGRLVDGALADLAPRFAELVRDRGEDVHAEFLRAIALPLAQQAGCGPNGLTAVEFEKLLSSRLHSVEKVGLARRTARESAEAGAAIVSRALDGGDGDLLALLDETLDRYMEAGTYESRSAIAMAFFDARLVDESI